MAAAAVCCNGGVCLGEGEQAGNSSPTIERTVVVVDMDFKPNAPRQQATLAPMDEIEEFDLEFDMDSPRGTQV